MRLHFMLLSLFMTLSTQANIIDLGDLSIEGEVRRPLITTIQAPQSTIELAKRSAQRNFEQIVQSNLNSAPTQEFLQNLESGRMLKEKVLK